jgi:hypothetical protein
LKVALLFLEGSGLLTGNLAQADTEIRTTRAKGMVLNKS